MSSLDLSGELVRIRGLLNNLKGSLQQLKIDVS